MKRWEIKIQVTTEWGPGVLILGNFAQHPFLADGTASRRLSQCPLSLGDSNQTVGWH